MADQELTQIRTMFVEKAMNELINQLLDDLLEERVLNDGERDSILEENRSRADKARALIDAVRRKGADASSRMMAHIQRRDSFLYSELAMHHGLLL